LESGWLLTINRESEQVMTQANREDKFEITPMFDTSFCKRAY
jgi:hypothetical protein